MIPKPLSISHWIHYRCEQRISYNCEEFICGLKLYKTTDEDIFAELLDSIREVQQSGAKVKLAYGGVRYGNLKVPTKVKILYI